MKIERNYHHKNTDTTFGTVAIDFPTGGWTLDGHELSEESVRAVVNQGLQILQDAYAGCGQSKTIDEAKAAYANKYQALVDGTIGQRSVGDGKPPHWRHVRGIIRKALGPDNDATYKAIPSDQQAERAKFLDELFDGLGKGKQKAVEDAAKAQYEREQEQRRAAESVAGDIEL